MKQIWSKNEANEVMKYWSIHYLMKQNLTELWDKFDKSDIL